MWRSKRKYLGSTWLNLSPRIFFEILYKYFQYVWNKTRRTAKIPAKYWLTWRQTAGLSRCSGLFTTQIMLHFSPQSLLTDVTVTITFHRKLLNLSLRNSQKHLKTLFYSYLLAYIYNKFNIIKLYAFSSVANRTSARNANTNRISMMVRRGNYTTNSFKFLSFMILQ